MINTIFDMVLIGANIIIGIVSLVGIFFFGLSGIQKWVLEKLHAKEFLALYEKDHWEDKRIERYKTICYMCVWWTTFWNKKSVD